MGNQHAEGLPPGPSIPISDEGDETRFCRSCSFSGACISEGYGRPELAKLHCLVEHVGPFRRGEYIFRTGYPFRSIFAVRTGAVKTSAIDADGREQVLGFYLPGEVIGLNGIYSDQFPCNAIVLDTTYFCRFSFPAMRTLAAAMPAVQQHLFRLLSRELGAATLLAGDHSADARVAAFLTNVGDRYAAAGLSGTRFPLSMSRSDIANYLRLAAETVSRVLGRLRSRGLIAIEGRVLQVRDPAGLRHLGRHLLSK